MKKIPFCFLLILLAAFTNAQSVKIPAYTGYAVPTEKDEQTLFSESKGLTSWTDTRQSIHWFFKARQTGELELSFHTKAINGGSDLIVAIAGKKFPVKLVSG
ncbi:MAG: hypothetical protein RI983_1733, partial [Bacteroidota bacterium]